MRCVPTSHRGLSASTGQHPTSKHQKSYRKGLSRPTGAGRSRFAERVSAGPQVLEILESIDSPRSGFDVVDKSSGYAFAEAHLDESEYCVPTPVLSF